MASPPQGQSASTADDVPIETVAGLSVAKRTIKAFFSGSSGESSTSTPISPVQPKRKRKKVEDGPAQGKLGLGGGPSNGSTSSAWIVERPAEVPKGRKKGRGPARGKDEVDEDAELKEMVRKAREAEKEAKRIVKGRRAEINGNGIVHDNSYIGEGTPEPPQDPNSKSNPAKHSPVKRKRGPNKSRLSQQTPPPPDIVNLVSSDPPDPHSPFPLPPPLEITITGHTKISPFKKRTSHPFFTRVDSRGAMHDPIDVDVSKSPSRPRKLVFAADGKQAHGFFGSGKGNGVSRGGSVGSDTGTEVSVITDVKGKGKEREKMGKVHALFMGNGVDVPGEMRRGWGRGVKEGEEWIAPLPGGSWPNHAECSYDHTAGSSQRGKRYIPLDYEDSTWVSLIDLSTPAECLSHSHDSGRLAIPIAHPAMSLLSAKRDPINRSAWTERYRPTRACEVLGNETESTYLRDWLSALSVGGSSRKIIRKVKEPKYRLIDDWIVDDAGVFGKGPTSHDGESDAESEVEAIEEKEVALGDRPDTYPSLGGRLTNTILLAGKSGVGKSAAVYAAASELGWEVFEVNPGMGRRTGGNLMSWVGDVGRNHMVDTAGVNEVRGAMNGFLCGGNGTRKVDRNVRMDTGTVLGSQGSAAEPIALEEDDIPRVPTNGHGKRESKTSTNDKAEVPSVRQSLILIDEVDILFNEENTFWPSIISLIAESRRPIVLVCNDSTRVPVGHLPLQTTLHFHPPRADLAMAYLGSLANNEGLSQQADYYENLYTTFMSYQHDDLDKPLPPNGNEPITHFDLRRAITQMQLDRNVPQSTLQHETQATNLANTLRYLEMQSFVDVHVKPSWVEMETLEIDRHCPTPDDEMGIHMLLKPDIHEMFPILASSSQCSNIADYLLSAHDNPRGRISKLAEERAKYIRSLLPLLDPIIPLSSHLLPHESLFINVMPVLRGMVEVDDVLEAEERDAVRLGLGRINRKTGRPQRVGAGEGYMRYLKVGARGLEAARKSGFE